MSLLRPLDPAINCNQFLTGGLLKWKLNPELPIFSVLTLSRTLNSFEYEFFSYDFYFTSHVL